MDAWAIFWGVVLLASLATFAIVVVVVTIGGFRDLRAMLKNLDAQHQKNTEDNVHAGKEPDRSPRP